MVTVMKATEFVNKLTDIAKNYKTLYVMGCIGAPMTESNKKTYINHHSYNQKPARVKCINAATSDTFGFDCVCLIKSVLWGWKGDKTKTYGGAKYKSNGVPDVNADGMIKLCSNVTTDFSKIEVGEAVWTDGHIGVYIGDGLAVECTPAWKNKVQITACNVAKSGYNTRKWKKHGKLPYVDYTVMPTSNKVTTSTKKVEYAEKKSDTLSGVYKVTASALHIRTGAGTSKSSLGTLKKDTKVTNYGFYSLASNGAKWLYVQTDTGLTGFCSLRYLKKV